MVVLYCLVLFFATSAELSSCATDPMAQSLKYLLSGSLQKTFADPRMHEELLMAVHRNCYEGYDYDDDDEAFASEPLHRCPPL